jgi:DNA-binding protein HU-beta
VNKTGLAESVQKELGGTKADAARAVEAVLGGIATALKKDKDGVALVGFGSFVVRERKARTGRNPQTGATIKIPKRKVIGFKAGKALKGKI